VSLGEGTRVALPEALPGTEGQPVLLGVRPEHLRLAPEGGIGARVVVVEPTGADTFVSCEHQGQSVSVLFRERHAFQPGSTIRLAADPAQLHVFDAASGLRVDAGIARSAQS
jgi:multiple sugar transport system ATP-binding protein